MIFLVCIMMIWVMVMFMLFILWVVWLCCICCGVICLFWWFSLIRLIVELIFMIWMRRCIFVVVDKCGFSWVDDVGLIGICNSMSMIWMSRWILGCIWCWIGLRRLFYWWFFRFFLIMLIGSMWCLVMRIMGVFVSGCIVFILLRW